MCNNLSRGQQGHPPTTLPVNKSLLHTRSRYPRRFKGPCSIEARSKKGIRASHKAYKLSSSHANLNSRSRRNDPSSPKAFLQLLTLLRVLARCSSSAGPPWHY